MLRSADVITAHVSKLADQHRAHISEELVEPLASDAVAFCPDLWSDPIHQISYLGIAVTLVNDQFEYRSYNLCCSPYEGDDKTAGNIIVVSVFLSSPCNYLFFLGVKQSIRTIQHQ